MSTQSLTFSSLVPASTETDLVRDKLQNTTFVGIDFGTSTTVASYAVPGESMTPIRAETIPIQQKRADGSLFEHHLVPSYVAWFRDELFVGVGARELSQQNRVTDGRTVWSSFKMDLGVDLGPQYHSTALDRNHPEYTIETPQQAAAVFLKYLRERIEHFVESEDLPPEVRYSISIPASFEPNQREDLMRALEQAGITLPEQAFIDEPNAAFLNYLTEANLHEESKALQIPSGDPLRILVFDFGAGTCDISILEFGNGPEGIYSKNLAISRFEVLGGDNIDREIVRQILVDQLCDHSDVSRDELRQTEIKRRVVPYLKSQAERLKVRGSKRIASESLGRHLPSMATDSDTSIEFGVDVNIRLMRHTLTADRLKMTFEQFSDVMKGFTAVDGVASDSEDVISIFQPVRSAIRKAKIEPYELDLILLIGGSAESPYVQSALYDYFDEHAVEVETPRDLRAHVSTGAAINSMLVNGLGVELVRPITSEPIYAIVRDVQGETLHLLVDASTEIPSPARPVEGLRVGEEGQQSVEIPICVGSRNKLIATLKVKASTSGGFKKGTEVLVSVEVTRDKLLRVKAHVGDQIAETEVVQPFANKEMSPRERALSEAEKTANQIMKDRGGRASIPALISLAEAAERAGDPLRAAEVLEQVQMVDPSQKLETTIGVRFSKAGRHDLSREWHEKAYEDSPNALTAFNMAASAWNSERDTEQFVAYLEEALEHRSTYLPALVSLGDHLHQRNKNRATEYLEKAFEILQARQSRDQLLPGDAKRLKRVAELLGKKDTLESLLGGAWEEDDDGFSEYESDNLAVRAERRAIRGES